MGSNLAIVTQAFSAGENQTWLGSAHGTNTCDSITLDADAFLTTFPTGIVPSGVVLGKVTASGLYRQYIDANSDGTQTALGLLFTTTDLGGTTAAVTDKVTAALFWHGEVIQANLPTGHGLDAAGITDLKQIKFV